jgi:hypothetical protein
VCSSDLPKTPKPLAALYKIKKMQAARDTYISSYCINTPGALVWIAELAWMLRMKDKLWNLIAIAVMMITYHVCDIV